MNRMKYGLLLVALVGLAGVDTSAHAQFRYVRPQTNPGYPTVSPYLNLNRGGIPGINYYGLVRPQFQTAQSLQALSQQTQFLQQGLANQAYVDAQGRPIAGVTGHRSTFFNTSHYFPLPGQLPGNFTGVNNNLGFGGFGGGLGVGADPRPRVFAVFGN